MNTILKIIKVMANSRKFDFGNKIYCLKLFTDLKARFRKKGKIEKQRVIFILILLGRSVKIIDVPMKNIVNMSKVDIFCSMVIVSEKRSDDGGYNEDGNGDDGDDDRDGGGEYVVGGGDGDGEDGDGEDGDGEDGNGEDGDGDDGRDCGGAGSDACGGAGDCSGAGRGQDEDGSEKQRVMLLGASARIIDVPIKNNMNMSEIDIFRSMGSVSERMSGGNNEDGDGENGNDGGGRDEGGRDCSGGGRDESGRDCSGGG
jgi:hypothetical protein